MLNYYINKGRPAVKYYSTQESQQKIQNRIDREFFVDEFKYAQANLEGYEKFLQICVKGAYIIESQEVQDVLFSDYTITIDVTEPIVQIHDFSGIVAGCREFKSGDTNKNLVSTKKPEYVVLMPGPSGSDHFIVESFPSYATNGFLRFPANHKILEIGNEFTYIRVNNEDLGLVKNIITIVPHESPTLVTITSQETEPAPRRPFHKKDLLYIVMPFALVIDIVTFPFQFVFFLINPPG